jgi:hypothetical protein
MRHCGHYSENCKGQVYCFAGFTTALPALDDSLHVGVKKRESGVLHAIERIVFKGSDHGSDGFRDSLCIGRPFVALRTEVSRVDPAHGIAMR